MCPLPYTAKYTDPQYVRTLLVKSPPSPRSIQFESNPGPLAYCAIALPLAKRFLLIEPILLNILLAKCHLPYTAKYIDPQYVSLLRTLLAKSLPPPAPYSL